MANYFHIDENGTKRGPINEEQIKQLARYHQISPTTLLETENGVQIPAGEIPDLFDTQSTTASTSVSESAIPDIGFTEFLTPVLITIIWWLSVITTIGSCLYVMYQISSFDMPDVAKGIGCLLVIGIAGDGLLWCRVILEYFAVQFRMERHQRTIKEILERNEKATKP